MGVGVQLLLFVITSLFYIFFFARAHPVFLYSLPLLFFLFSRDRSWVRFLLSFVLFVSSVLACVVQLGGAGWVWIDIVNSTILFPSWFFFRKSR